MSKGEVDAEVFEVDVSDSLREQVMKSLGHMDVQKDSQQVNQDKQSGVWADPPVSFSSLLRFYKTNIYHRRCVNLKALLITGLGWELVTDDDNKEEDENYKRIKELLDNPNSDPTQTFTELCLRAMIDYQALGNLFIEASRKYINKQTDEFFHVRAKTMRRDKSLDKGYWQVLREKKQEFRSWGKKVQSPGKVKNEIIHHYAYDPEDSHYGSPDWYPSLADMILDRNVVEYDINLFLNQLMAKFIIVVEGGQLSPTAKTSLKDYLSKNFHGLQNAGRTIILSSDDPEVKIRIEKLEIDFGNKESFKGGMREISRDNVIAAHGVPHRLVPIIVSGQLGSGNENEGQLTVFKETLITPEQSRWEELLNNTIIKSLDPGKWRLKFNEFDPTNLESISSALKNLVDGNILDEDEAREYIGHQPREQDPNESNLIDLTKNVVNLRKQLEGWDG